MTLPGETVGAESKDDVAVCSDCGQRMPIEVLLSAAGYYIGFFCGNCGPYSRESGYYGTHNEAQEALEKGTFFRF